MNRSLRRLAALFATALALSGCPGSSKDDGPIPTADAGLDRTVAKRTLVLLDGSGSVPAPGWTGTMRYRWTQLAGAPVTLSDATAAMPTFTTPAASGPLVFSLVVTAGGTSAPASVVLTVANRPPVPVTGGDLTVRGEWLATLDAYASWDPDGDPLTVTWVQTAGPAVILDTPSPGLARFTAPAIQGSLGFVAVVSDGEASAEAPVSVRVLPPGANVPPLADAGPDQDVARFAYVTLYGSGSDPDGLPVTFLWDQIGGPPVPLYTMPGQPVISFYAPAGPADLEFRLTVGDGLDSASDTVLVRVRNQPPSVQGLAITPVQPRTTDDLGVTAMVTDPEGDAYTLAYAWRLNGAEVPGQTGAIFPASLTSRGDVVSVTVTASDATGSGSATATVTVVDAPPVLRVDLPAEIPWGAAASAQITVADPDGDPVVPGAITLEYGPIGMSVSAADVLTWTPRLPMFDRTLDVRFGLRMAGDPPGRMDGSVRVVDPARTQAMRRGGLEVPRGQGAVIARDLDGDGRDELLISGVSGVYELGATAGGYAMAWEAPFDVGVLESSYSYGGSTAVAAADLDGDGFAELFYGTQAQLVRLDGATRRETGRASLAGGDRWRACEAADVDGDGVVEVACLVGNDSGYYGTTGRLLVLDASTMSVEWETGSLALGAALAVGNADDDAALEIVTSGGYVYDGATRAPQWTYGPGFGSVVRIGHPTAGGAPLIVGGAPLRGYSAILRSPLWEASASVVLPFVLRDVDGDGADELVTLSAYSTALTGWRIVGGPTPLTQLFSVDLGLYQYSMNAMVAGDLDGDGALELAWDDGGSSSSGEGALRVAGPISAAATLEWRSPAGARLDGPMLAGGLARTAPGVSRLAFLSARGGARVVLLDPATGALSAGTAIAQAYGQSSGLAVADYDGDGVDQVFVGTDNYYDPFFAAWDPVTDTLPWRSGTLGSLSYSERVVAVKAADMNGDGFPDLVGLTGSGTIWIEDVHGASVLWKSISLGSGVALAVADLDGDGRPEVVAAAGARVVTYRWSAQAGLYLETAAFAAPGVTDLAVGDCDDDGAPEVYALAQNDIYYPSNVTVTRLDGALAPLATFALPLRASALFVEDLGPGRKNLVASTVTASSPYTEGPGVLVSLDPVTGSEVWRSPPLFGAVPRDGAAWVQLGGAWRLAFGAGKSMYLTQ